MHIPKFTSIHTRVQDCYLADVPLAMEYVKTRMINQVVAFIFKENAIEINSCKNHTTHEHEFSLECCILTKKDLKDIILNAVNRSHTGMPPLQF